MRNKLLVAGQVAGVGCATAGVALWTVPGALVAFGVFLVALGEIRGAS